MSTPQDYALLFKHKINLPTAVYFLSKIFSLAYITTSTIFVVSPVGSCQALQVALGICYIFAVSSSSLLFIFRVRAVFHFQPMVVYLFYFLWVAVLGSAMIIPFSIAGMHIGPTRMCINTEVKPYTSAAVIINGVNDTLVFLAISWRLLTMNLVDESWSARVRSFVHGRGFSRLTGTLLHGGQLYYLATVGVNILTIVMVLTPSVPPFYRAVFTIPNIALENAMACRVFRQLKLGIIAGGDSTSFTASAAQRTGMVMNFGGTGRGNRSELDSEAALHSLQDMRPSREDGIRVKVRRDSDVRVDGDTPKSSCLKLPESHF